MNCEEIARGREATGRSRRALAPLQAHAGPGRRLFTNRSEGRPHSHSLFYLVGGLLDAGALHLHHTERRRFWNRSFADASVAPSRQCACGSVRRIRRAGHSLVGWLSRSPAAIARPPHHGSPARIDQRVASRVVGVSGKLQNRDWRLQVPHCKRAATSCVALTAMALGNVPARLPHFSTFSLRVGMSTQYPWRPALLRPGTAL